MFAGFLDSLPAAELRDRSRPNSVANALQGPGKPFATQIDQQDLLRFQANALYPKCMDVLTFYFPRLVRWLSWWYPINVAPCRNTAPQVCMRAIAKYVLLWNHSAVGFNSFASIHDQANNRTSAHESGYVATPSGYFSHDHALKYEDPLADCDTKFLARYYAVYKNRHHIRVALPAVWSCDWRRWDDGPHLSGLEDEVGRIFACFPSHEHFLRGFGRKLQCCPGPLPARPILVSNDAGIPVWKYDSPYSLALGKR
ncbi:hypothetical protein B0H10DRAFT_1947852 [Mycena sp. CBHHK59/15]|nr:hypothetical protein B0H10DRAFT_1947852 [Mycena sp. CBHHK59/15]